MKKFTQIIENNINPSDDIEKAVKSLFNTTAENLNIKVDDLYIDFKKAPEEVNIEGFINDSDVYDFYLKWRNEVDEILTDSGFFNESHDVITSLYDFVIFGTKKAFQLIVNHI